MQPFRIPPTLYYPSLVGPYLIWSSTTYVDPATLLKGCCIKTSYVIKWRDQMLTHNNNNNTKRICGHLLNVLSWLYFSVRCRFKQSRKLDFIHKQVSHFIFTCFWRGEICRLMKIVLIVVKDRQKTSKIDVIPNLKVKDNGSPPRDPHRLLWVAPSSPLVYVN